MIRPLTGAPAARCSRPFESAFAERDESLDKAVQPFADFAVPQIVIFSEQFVGAGDQETAA
jgi:hypothetical protein